MLQRPRHVRPGLDGQRDDVQIEGQRLTDLACAALAQVTQPAGRQKAPHRHGHRAPEQTGQAMRQHQHHQDKQCHQCAQYLTGHELLHRQRKLQTGLAQLLLQAATGGAGNERRYPECHGMTQPAQQHPVARWIVVVRIFLLLRHLGHHARACQHEEPDAQHQRADGQEGQGPGEKLTHDGFLLKTDENAQIPGMHMPVAPGNMSADRQACPDGNAAAQIPIQPFKFRCQHPFRCRWP